MTEQPKLIPIEPGLWRVAKDFTWRHITVPAGFVCDLDSVPRIPYVYSRFKNRTVAASVIHDYLYYRQTTTRKEADRLFSQAMKDEGVGSYHRRIIYRAVRMFGWHAWRKNQ